MRTNFISTVSLSSTLRGGTAKLQNDLAKASAELGSGRFADVGLELGVKTGRSVTLRQQNAALEALKGSNALAAAQLDTAQAALADISKGADAFLQSLLAVPQAAGSGKVLQDQAQGLLDSFTASVNVNDGTRYVFGGTNSSQKPLNDYEDGPKAAVDAAFLAKFGFVQDDPQVATISSAAMSDFLDNEFAAIFNGGWDGTWSSASDTNRTSAISGSETVDVSSNANEKAFRQLTMAYTLVGQLGTAGLSDGTLDAVVDKARDLVSGAMLGFNDISAHLGTSQARIDASNDMIELAQDNADSQITALEGVDPAEAKTRVDTLTTQIEMSYSLTSQILKLSIINYI